MEILREVIPLGRGDCYMIFKRSKDCFDFPFHLHPEIEINLVLDAFGAQRVVGDNIEEIGSAEILVIGPNLPHGWFNNGKTFKNITEVTLQFRQDLFSDSFLQRNQMYALSRLFEDAKRGIAFSSSVAYSLAGKLMALSEGATADFSCVLEFFDILNTLANSSDRRILSSVTFNQDEFISDSRRIEKIFDYISKNYQNKITLSDAAMVANMSEVAFSRYFKAHSGGVTFVNALNDFRLGHVCRLLIDTTMTVSEIAYACGFNNMANFNRIFLKKKGLTPTEFREVYFNHKKFI